MMLNGIPIPANIEDRTVSYFVAEIQGDANQVTVRRFLQHITQLLQHQESPASGAESLDDGGGEDPPLIEELISEPIPQPSSPVQSHQNFSSSSSFFHIITALSYE